MPSVRHLDAATSTATRSSPSTELQAEEADDKEAPWQLDQGAAGESRPESRPAEAVVTMRPLLSVQIVQLTRVLVLGGFSSHSGLSSLKIIIYCHILGPTPSLRLRLGRSPAGSPSSFTVMWSPCLLVGKLQRPRRALIRSAKAAPGGGIVALKCMLSELLLVIQKGGACKGACPEHQNKEHIDHPQVLLQVTDRLFFKVPGWQGMGAAICQEGSTPGHGIFQHQPRVAAELSEGGKV
ncbi:PREDICTED: uncharacterized protein LOC106148890 [Chinchilla lanigera]|uniref:uncharacterized protein LOC106148890 n=1 Tax=Chinchilla lanigera TaxID=34839 RepID=UPI0006984A0F|nr:PREDICTED: uncharacterized protein LOC106148890 [Chinchilla lanigera]